MARRTNAGYSTLSTILRQDDPQHQQHRRKRVTGEAPVPPPLLPPPLPAVVPATEEGIRHFERFRQTFSLEEIQNIGAQISDDMNSNSVSDTSRDATALVLAERMRLAEEPGPPPAAAAGLPERNRVHLVRQPRPPRAPNTPDGQWSLMFQYQVKSHENRHPDRVLELAPEFDLEAYPNRLLLARHITRPPPPIKDGKQEVYLDKRTGKPLAPYTYNFWIFSSLGRFLSEFNQGRLGNSEADNTFFAIAEENGATYAYFDLELPRAAHIPELHGSSGLDLAAYQIGLLRTMLSIVLGVNVSCWGDSYCVYESSDATKWSFHVHVGWPFRNIGALRAAMGEVYKLLDTMQAAELMSVRFVHYTKRAKDGSGAPDKPWSYWDPMVYTKKRNFRLPFNTKRAKNAWLKPANAAVPLWNRPQAEDPDSANISGIEACIMSGMILARNSPPFWNRATIKDPRWDRTRKPAPGEFRCLPLSSALEAHRTAIKRLCSERAWEGADPVPVVSKHLDELFRGMLDERPFTLLAEELEPAARGPVDELLAACTSCPRRLAVAMRLLCRCYRPGHGLLQNRIEYDPQTQQAIDAGPLLSSIASWVECFHAQLWNGDQLLGCDDVYPEQPTLRAAHYYLHVCVRAEAFRSSTVSASRRAEFVCQFSDFVKRFLDRFIIPRFKRTPDILLPGVLFDLPLLEALYGALLIASPLYPSMCFQREQPQQQQQQPYDRPLNEEQEMRAFEWAWATAKRLDEERDEPVEARRLYDHVVRGRAPARGPWADLVPLEQMLDIDTESLGNYLAVASDAILARTQHPHTAITFATFLKGFDRLTDDCEGPVAPPAAPAVVH